MRLFGDDARRALWQPPRNELMVLKYATRMLLLGIGCNLAACDGILGIGDTFLAPTPDASLPKEHGDSGSTQFSDGSTGESKRLPDSMPDAGRDTNHTGMDSGIDTMDAKSPTDATSMPDASASASDAASTRHDGSADAAVRDAAAHDAKAPDFDAGTLDPDRDADDDAEVPQPWIPARLSGLVIWLDAAYGVEVSTSADRVVERWRDRSGHGHDALQSDPSRRPVWRTGAANDLPTVEFNGTTSVVDIDDADELNFGTDDFTIEFVTAWTNVLAVSTSYWGYGALFEKQLLIEPYAGIGVWANMGVPDPQDPQTVYIDSHLGASITGVQIATPESGYNDGRFRLYTLRRVGGTMAELRINGTTTVSQSLDAALSCSAPARPIEIGGSTISNNQFLSGAISEIVVVRGALSDGEFSQTESYFRSKYRLW